MVKTLFPVQAAQSPSLVGVQAKKLKKKKIKWKEMQISARYMIPSLFPVLESYVSGRLQVISCQPIFYYFFNFLFCTGI